MSKLAPGLKALINAPSARPGPTPAARGIADVYARIAHEAKGKNLSVRPWVAISAAATFTLNSPASLPHLHALASTHSSPVQAAELIREVGLKCISFNGIPRTINCLNAFHASLPADVQSQLATQPSRTLTPENVDQRLRTGRALWDSVYAPHEDKLFDKLTLAHPDLPVYILSGHYALVLSDPEGVNRGALGSLGRVLTSIVAISCLRSQTGVGPQVLSHVFGLRKGVADGTWKGDVEQSEAEWLAGDEGGEWVLNSVDGIRGCLGEEGFASKL